MSKDIRKWLLYEGSKFYIKQLLFNRHNFKYLKRPIAKRIKLTDGENALKVELVYSIPLKQYIYVHSTRSYSYSGFYEYNVVKYLRKKAREVQPCLFIDIGAYVGYYSLLMAREGCDVIAFEPDPRNFVLLMNNLVMSRFRQRITALNKAVCNKQDSWVYFNLSKSPSESSSTIYLKEELVEFASYVPCITLDALISTLNLSGKNLIVKVDVEGAFLSVLRGATYVIANLKPCMILEVHRTFNEDDELMSLRLLRDCGYRWKILEWRNLKNFIVALEPRALVT